ncbi:MAG: GGDEF domain-containing protein [Planctomycetes bacterium]|jgi:diguanylate cyclase (GGDEF)-like protein|nr:GGDEF domain-containing protein [Planctomycetota bacterium]
MTRPGFRKGRPGGARPTSGADSGDGFLSSALFSQAQILHLMKNEFARARRHGVPLGCIMLQVDRLPQLVDLHGVDLRQAVRAAVARLVREKTRGSDLLGTTNDDRYLLVLPHTNLAQSRSVAERLHQLFDEFGVAVDGRELSLSLSVGVTACDDQKTLFFDSMLAQAEAALEYAADHGGDQVASFGEIQLRGGGSDAGPGASPRRRASDRRDGEGHE